jgi:hypothetical protein
VEPFDVLSVACLSRILVTWGTMARIFENPAHWRQRAEETRAIAADLTDPMGKQMLLGVALAYDSLAVCAEQRKDLQDALINRRNDHPKI